MRRRLGPYMRCALVCVGALALAGCVQRVTVGINGAAPNGASSQPALSADGRFVAFTSSATNLVGGDTNGLDDIFVRDTQAKATTLVSVGRGSPADGPSSDPSVSRDGRYVLFASTADNLVAGDTNALQDVFLRDVVGGTTTRVASARGGGQLTTKNSSPTMSSDATVVAFVATGQSGSEVVVRDIPHGTTTVLDPSPACPSGETYLHDVSNVAVAGTGRYVAFATYCTSSLQVVEYDRTAHTWVARESDYYPELYGIYALTHLRYSADGNVLAWVVSQNGADGYARTDGSLYNRAANTGGGFGGGAADVQPTPGQPLGVSSDGRYIAFIGGYHDGKDGAEGAEAFVSDTTTGVVSIASIDGNRSPTGAGGAALSDDGNHIAFVTSVPMSDSDPYGANIYERDRTDAVPVPDSFAYVDGGDRLRVNEPAAGRAITLTFDVSLVGAIPDSTTTLAWHTVNGSATSPADYDAVVGGVSPIFLGWPGNPGGSAQLSVTVLGDPTNTRPEQFSIVLDTPGFSSLGPLTITIG